MVADPSTFRVLPWAPQHRLAAVRPQVSRAASRCRSTRAACCRQALAQLGEAGYGYRAGLEIEFHVFRIVDRAPAPGGCGPAGLAAGGGAAHHRLPAAVRDALRPARAGAGDPARATSPASACRCAASSASSARARPRSRWARRTGLAAADAMMLFRSAAKQILRRHGYHATFMCRPKLPNVMSSGWHLHQSSRPQNGKNAFVSDKDFLSETGKHFLAGLLEHARGLARVRHADDQRLQALPPLLARARARDLGPRQPRRDAARAGRARAIRRRASRTASASRRRIPTSTSRRRSTAGWTACARKLDPGAPEQTALRIEGAARCRARSTRRSGT